MWLAGHAVHEHFKRIELQNVAALADTLTRVVSDADLRRRIGSAARERALEHFSLEVMVSRYRALYDRVMA